MNAEDFHEQPSHGALGGKSDAILLAVALVLAISLALVVVLIRGDRVSEFATLWGWIVNLSIWIYLFVSAI
jgi:hypothetical protein